MAYTATPRFGSPDMWQKTQTKSPSAYQASTPVSYTNYAPTPPPPPKAPAAPQPTPSQPAQPAPQPATPSYDYSMDPILNQILALSTQQRSGATSSALAAKKQLAIDYGDSALARSLGDDATATAAEGNPFSVRKQLQTGYERGTEDLTTGYERDKTARATNYERDVESTREDYNKRNLFYSGHFGQAKDRAASDYQQQTGYADTDFQRALQRGTFDYQGALYGAGREQQGLLGQIDSGLLQALLAADQADIGGQSDAYGRALQFALTNGIDPGAAPAAQPDPVAQQLAAPPPPVQLAPPAETAAQRALRLRSEALNRQYGLG